MFATFDDFYSDSYYNFYRCEQLDKMMGCTGSKRTCSCFGVKKRKISYDEEYSSSSCRSSEVDVQYRGCRMRKADTSGLLQMLVPRNFFRGFRKNHDLSMTKIEISKCLVWISYCNKKCGLKWIGWLIPNRVVDQIWANAGSWYADYVDKILSNFSYNILGTLCQLIRMTANFLFLIKIWL